METNQKLFHRDFALLVVGQIISLFGNSVIRFALSLYVLDFTGSAAAFGGILAISMIPLVVFSPLGGVLADRVNKRNIMVALDYATAAIILGFTLAFLRGETLVPVAVIMLLLTTIQAFYQPSVQSSIPLLAKGENLPRANGVVVQVNALSNLLGPILGGFLYGFLPIQTILMAGAGCFFLSATMELFLRIPHKKLPKADSLARSVVGDLKQALRFLVRENAPLFKLLLVVAAINLFLSAMIMVGLPYLVKVFLGLPGTFNGFAEGALFAGSILGGCLAGFFFKRVDIKRSYLFLLVACIAVLPIAPAVISSASPYLSYAVILSCILICMASAALFTIFAQTFAQQQTPEHLLGKVSACVAMVSTCALPLGQAMYGALFEGFHSSVYVVILFAGAVGILLALLAKRVLRKVEAQRP